MNRAPYGTTYVSVGQKIKGALLEFQVTSEGQSQTEWLSSIIGHSELTPECVHQINDTFTLRSIRDIHASNLFFLASQQKWKANKMKQSRKLQSLFFLMDRQQWIFPSCHNEACGSAILTGRKCTLHNAAFLKQPDFSSSRWCPTGHCS